MTFDALTSDDIAMTYPWNRLRKAGEHFKLTDFSDDVVSGFRLLVETVRIAQNDNAAFLGSNVTTKLPKDVVDRTTHFRWNRNRFQRKLMVSSWILLSEYDNRDFTLMLDKYSALDPMESLDDVWRVTGNDWTVTFLASTYAGQLEPNQYISLSYESAMALPRRLYNATLFSLDNVDGFMYDVVQWKLTMET